MPIVEKVEKDDATYNFTRPGPDQLGNERAQKQLKDIESARKAALQQKRTRPTKAPDPEPGFKFPIYDQKHRCWRSQSETNPKDVRVWDEGKRLWRSKDSNSKLCKPHSATQRLTQKLGLSNTSDAALLDPGQRTESWFQSIWRRRSVWATGLFGK